MLYKLSRDRAALLPFIPLPNTLLLQLWLSLTRKVKLKNITRRFGISNIILKSENCWQIYIIMLHGFSRIQSNLFKLQLFQQLWNPCISHSWEWCLKNRNVEQTLTLLSLIFLVQRFNKQTFSLPVIVELVN